MKSTLMEKFVNVFSLQSVCKKTLQEPSIWKFCDKCSLCQYRMGLQAYQGQSDLEINLKWPLQRKSVPFNIQKNNVKPNVEVCDRQIIDAEISDGWKSLFIC